MVPTSKAMKKTANVNNPETEPVTIGISQCKVSFRHLLPKGIVVLGGDDLGVVLKNGIRI
jgi:hypothetical protein